MKANLQFASILVAGCASILLSLPVAARPTNPGQDQGTAQTQSGPQQSPQHVACAHVCSCRWTPTCACVLAAAACSI
jgi:hypothetical protein